LYQNNHFHNFSNYTENILLLNLIINSIAFLKSLYMFKNKILAGHNSNRSHPFIKLIVYLNGSNSFCNKQKNKTKIMHGT
jgi:hypothetical protein